MTLGQFHDQGDNVCYKIRYSLGLDQPGGGGRYGQREYQHWEQGAYLVQGWIGCGLCLKYRVILMSYVSTNGHMYGAYLQYVSRPVTFNSIMVTL
jgi:hypothetical protein